jgi:DNA modification methylase
LPTTHSKPHELHVDPELPALVGVDKSLDERDEFQARFGTAPGQLWRIGRHRIYCGDATDPASWDRLGRPSGGLLVTDPPYGVKYNPAWRLILTDHGAHKPVRATGDVANDDRADWREVFELADCSVAYVWFGALHAAEVSESLRSGGYEMRYLITWAKQHLVLSRGDYHWQTEHCWYAVKKGCPRDFVGDRAQTTLWNIRNQNAFGKSKNDKRTSHSTQKPLECMARPIRLHAHKVVVDPFLGSGTTAEAAERLGRTCYGIDTDPGYVGIALDRLQRVIGQDPELVSA